MGFSTSTVQNFFDMINKSIDSGVSASKRDETIDAEVLELINAEAAQYRVSYKGSTLVAFAQDPLITYKKGERVYVLVPQGDYSAKKIITGRSSYSEAMTYKDLQAVRNFYIDVGPDWTQIYPEILQSKIGICACPKEKENELVEEAVYSNYAFDLGGNEKNDEISLWANESNQYIKIQGDFSTEFLGSHKKGEYFLRVVCIQTNPFYIEDPNEPGYDEKILPFNEVTFDLSFNDFEGGSFYNFGEPTTQKAYFQIPEGGILGLKAIILMQNGDFEFDSQQVYGESYLPTPNPIKNTNNIFVQNIKINFARKVNLADNIYYPYIETPYGISLYDGRNSIDLIPHLQYGDIDIIDQGNCEVHWFRQKVDITESSAAFEEPDKHGKNSFFYGGPGWQLIDKIIAQKKEESEDYDGYRLIGNTLRIQKSEVPFKWKYKAVMTYISTETVDGKEYYKELNRSEAIQEVQNLDSEYDLHLLPTNNNIAGFYEIVNNKDNREKRDWYGTWFQTTVDNSYKQLSVPYHEGPLNILDNPAAVWQYITVQCYDPYKYKPNKESSDTFPVDEIAVLDLQIGSNNEQKFIVDWVGIDHFSYDADGQWKGEKDGKEYILTPVVKFAEGFGMNYAIKIIAPDGQVLGNEFFYSSNKIYSNGKNSWSNENYLIKNAYIDSNFGIHFTVETKYDFDRAQNNIFTLELHMADGKVYTFDKQITFAKDGDIGTNGTEWNARIRPCNWRAESQEALFSEEIPENKIVPIVLNHNADGTYSQDDAYRLYLRPFVSRNGVPLESMDPNANYYYRCTWDVRTPGAENSKMTNGSCLRLHHTSISQVGKQYIATSGDKFNLQAGGVFETGDDGFKAGTSSVDIKVYNNDVENADGLLGYTVYPPTKEANRWNGESRNPFEQEENITYGAIEVRAKNGLTISEVENNNYRFVVKATITILQKANQGEENGRPITTIVSYYPVDIFFNEDGFEFLNTEMSGFEDKIKTNWPSVVKYDTIGYTPKTTTQDLYFNFDEGQNLWPSALVNTCELVFKEDWETKERISVKYKPIGHLSKQSGFHSALRTEPGAWPIKKEGKDSSESWLLRTQVMYYDRFGNVDINGWDGEGLDTNEKDGTIFGATFGAGFKVRNGDNAFTGILMGVDKNLKREDYDDQFADKYVSDSLKEALTSHPYMTGLFGYQEGIQSFGLLENGTAYFGRADRGGRIIIDGSNAMLYGGANGMFKEPSIKDAMWNCIRINLVDLNHDNKDELWDLISPRDTEDVASGYKVRNYNGDPIDINFSADYFGFAKDKTEADRFTVPKWYADVWRKAYIKPDGVRPYWMLNKNDEYGIKKNYEIDDLAWWDGKDLSGSSGDEKDQNKRVNYYDDFWVDLNSEGIREKYGNLPGYENYTRFPYRGIDSSVPQILGNETLENRLKLLRENGETLSISSFGPQRASTTPAIEIGQHIPGLYPGLTDWKDYDDIYRYQRIPGDRNFMVTYDGTLWAMNGVFMGNVIGSNILGGRIQGSQIGIGQRTDKVFDGKTPIKTLYGKDADFKCNWASLIAPVDGDVPLNKFALADSGFTFTADENGINAGGMEIIGGSLDIGGFHILGKPTIERLKNQGATVPTEDEIGHLIQNGKSDFIGLTHFYGNVGIGPNLRNGEADPSNSGSFVQINGFTALGVILPTESDLESHQYIDDYSVAPRSKKYHAGKDAYLSQELIGHGGSVEQSAMFCVDARGSSNFSSFQDSEGVNGHFWPLFFHCETKTPNAGGNEVYSYVTVMDQFKTTEQNSTATEEIAYDSSNYFRVSPWGTECQNLFIRSKFQPEEYNQKPKPDEDCKEASGTKAYRGYFGTVSRRGASIEEGALGITTWNKNRIILKSDSNMASRARTNLYISANAQVDGLDFSKTWAESPKNDPDNDQLMNMSIQMRKFEESQNGFGAFDIKTNSSPIGIGVYGENGSNDAKLGSYTYGGYTGIRGGQATGLKAALILDPLGGCHSNIYGTDKDNAVAVLGVVANGDENKSGVHIYCSADGSVSDDCSGRDISEIFCGKKVIKNWAENGIYIGAGSGNGGVHKLSSEDESKLTGGAVYIKAAKIKFKTPSAENQEGIYARFA